MPYSPDNAERPEDVQTVMSMQGRTVTRTVVWHHDPTERIIAMVTLYLDDGRTIQISGADSVPLEIVGGSA